MGFASLFPEINDYLNQTFAAIKDEALKDSLLEQEETSETFGTINLPDASANLCYLKALVLSRLERSRDAKAYFRMALEKEPSLRFRANLDPEMNELARNN